MSLPFTITIVFLIVLLVIIHKKQASTFSLLSKSINNLEAYKNKYLENNTSTKTSAPIKYNLEDVLEKYNKQLYPSLLELSYKKYIYPNNSAPPNLLNGTRNIIEILLATVKEHSGLNLKLLDIENIVELKNIGGSRKINSIFICHEIDQHYSRKLLLEYIMDNEGKISINSLKTLTTEPTVLLSEQYIKDNIADKSYTVNYSETVVPTADDSIYPFYYRYDSSKLPDWVYNSPQLVKDIGTLKKVCLTQEPCKYNQYKWNRSSVEPQVKLDKKCNVINHSDRVLPPDPYVNPTLFQLDY